MTRFLIMAGLMGLALVALTGSICDDRPGDPPPTLIGEYEGIYICRFAGQAEQEQAITWRFTSVGYRLSYDEANGSGRQFCDAAGTYEWMGSRTTLTEVDPNVLHSQCNEDQNPKGYFGIDQSTDTLVMVQFDGEITKTIRLVLIEEKE